MTASVRLDYFYGTEDKMSSFYRIPKAFEKNEAFRSVSLEVKYLYSIMLDRVSISARNGWLDAGRVFIYFSLPDVVKCIQAGRTKALQVLHDMETLGLIQRKKQGQGRPTRIFVKNIIETDHETVEQPSAAESADLSPNEEEQPVEPSCPNRSESEETEPPMFENLAQFFAAMNEKTEPAKENDIDLNCTDSDVEVNAEEPAVTPSLCLPVNETPDSSLEAHPVNSTSFLPVNSVQDEKREPPAPVSDSVRHTVFEARENSESMSSAASPNTAPGVYFEDFRARNDRSRDPQTAGFRTSRLPESEPLDVQILNPNYNNQNKNNSIYKQSIYPDRTAFFDKSAGPAKSASERLMDMNLTRELIHDNIDYDILSRERDPGDMERIDEYVELMVQTCCSTRDTVRINREDFPRVVVHSRFLKLNREHLLYVLECMKKNTTRIRNIRAYTLSALYNSYTTMESYYSMRVQHDMAKKG